MLMLSRKVDQSIAIDGGRIVVTVAEIRGERVRLGIEAPDEVDVDRMEVHRAKQREQEKGKQSDASENGDVA